MPTGQLTAEAQTSLKKLLEGQFLASEGDSLIIPPTITGKVSSLTRTYFKDKGVEVLREAADAAGKVWSPQ